jgi:5-methylcytosine-specific restriction protein A
MEWQLNIETNQRELMPTINKPKRSTKLQAPYKREWNAISNKYYGSPGWKKLRNQYILSHPLCEDCLLEGRSVPAAEIHHIIPWATGITADDKWKLLLDPNNLRALCIKHHKLVHQQLKNK